MRRLFTLLFVLLSSLAWGQSIPFPGPGMPNGGVGPLYVLFVSVRTSATITWPSGWTELYQGQDSAGSVSAGVAYSVDTPASLSVTISANRPAVWGIFRYNSYIGLPESATLAGTAADANPDPPTLSPTWGSAQVEWTTNLHWDQSSAASSELTSCPSGYSGVFALSNSSGSSTGFYNCNKVSTASSENPGTFTMTSARRYFVSTVGVRSAGHTSTTNGESLSGTSFSVTLP